MSDQLEEDHMNTSKIEELESKVAELTAIVERLTAPSSNAPASTTADAAAEAVSTSSRRGMLKLAGAAAAGAVAVAVGGNALPAAAATNGPLLIGVGTNAPTAATDLTTLNGNFAALNDSGASAESPGVNGTIFALNSSVAADTLLRGGVTGVGGAANGTSSGVLGTVLSVAKGPAGVSGFSDSSTVGLSAGVRAKSTTGPAIQLVPVAAGAPTTGTWSVGALQPDTTGRLFYCTVSGTPGTWVELTDVTTPVVALHIIDPVRVFDSRLALPSQGKLSSGNNKVVSIKDARDTTTGGVLVADVVPVGAVAIVGNLTVTNTVGAGFLSVVPGDATKFSASSINWFGTDQNLANGITAKIAADRSVKVFCGGGNATDFIIDVTGYYI
ncbi:MAG: hypothetical protein JWN62_2029 [Acidimicrobiales bacterium]|nr:hypothetical protein [Acidimicrobiales bacterium]